MWLHKCVLHVVVLCVAMYVGVWVFVEITMALWMVQVCVVQWVFGCVCNSRLNTSSSMFNRYRRKQHIDLGVYQVSFDSKYSKLLYKLIHPFIYEFS